MEADELQSLLQAQLSGCAMIDVQRNGNYFDIIAVGEVFAGLSAVKRQQLVYSVISQYITEGRIHAVNIKTYTPAQWDSEDRGQQAEDRAGQT
jgi:acid stress-induced BolA-like protein IbaG/YrbA